MYNATIEQLYYFCLPWTRRSLINAKFILPNLRTRYFLKNNAISVSVGTVL